MMHNPIGSPFKKRCAFMCIYKNMHTHDLLYLENNHFLGLWEIEKFVF